MGIKVTTFSTTIIDSKTALAGCAKRRTDAAMERFTKASKTAQRWGWVPFVGQALTDRAETRAMEVDDAESRERAVSSR